jgi:putative cell wall-binding protein
VAKATSQTTAAPAAPTDTATAVAGDTETTATAVTVESETTAPVDTAPVEPIPAQKAAKAPTHPWDKYKDTVNGLTRYNGRAPGA